MSDYNIKRVTDEKTGEIEFIISTYTDGTEVELLTPMALAKDNFFQKLTLPEGFYEFCEYALVDCVHVKHVNIPSTVERISLGAFCGCSSLESIEIPGSVKVISKDAFYGCSSLHTLIINEGVEKIKDEAFRGCKSLKKVILPKSIVEIGKSAFAIPGLEIIPLFNKDGTNLKTKWSFGATVTWGDTNTGSESKYPDSKKVDFIFDQDYITYTDVKFKDGSIADEGYLRKCLMTYAKKGSYEITDEAVNLIKELDIDSFDDFCRNILRILGKRLDSKNKWMLYFVINHASDNILKDYEEAIVEYGNTSATTTVTVEGVIALSTRISLEALKTMHSLQSSNTQKRAKAQIVESFDNLAYEIGYTTEQVGDLFIPTLGLENGYVIDYGTRKFTANINELGNLILVDDNNELIKKLPSILKSDDEDLATINTKAFKKLTSELKKVVKTQAERLIVSMIFERTWTYEEFNNTFINNPIMKQFATSLIWGIYEGDKFVNTFRYMTDGTFNDINDKSINLKGKTIGLIHPSDLTADEIKYWVNNLLDYEVKQSFLQLGRVIYKPEGDEITTNISNRCACSAINVYTLDKALLSSGWQRDSYSHFTKYYYEDIAELNFGGMKTYSTAKEPEPVNNIEFIDVKNCTEVTPKIFSEIILSSLEATKTGVK